MNCIYCEIFTTCDAKVDVTTTDDLLHGEGVRYVPWVDGCPKTKDANCELCKHIYMMVEDTYCEEPPREGCYIDYSIEDGFMLNTYVKKLGCKLWFNAENITKCPKCGREL